MSDIGVPLQRIWCCGYARVVLRLSLTASLLQWTLQVQAAPAAPGSQSTSLSSRGASDDSSSSGGSAGSGSFLDSVDVKYFLIIIALLLAVLIVVVVVVVVCRRHCRKGGRGPAAKSGEGSSSGHAELERTSERPQGAATVQTIGNDRPPLYCTCSAHCGGQVHLHHGSWPVSGALTVAASPMERTPPVTDVLSRPEPSPAGQVAGHVTPSAAVGQPEDGGGQGTGWWFVFFFIPRP